MAYKPFLLIVSLVLFPFILLGQPQAPPSVADLFSAQSYDRFTGEARFDAVRKLQKNDWYEVDTFFLLATNDGNKNFYTERHYLAPYVDDNGTVFYLVPDEAAIFPGGNKALETYLDDVLGPGLAAKKDEVQTSLYFRGVITSEGKVTDIVAAVPPPERVSEELWLRCLEGLRLMPDWLPAKNRGYPVDCIRLFQYHLNQ